MRRTLSFLLLVGILVLGACGTAETGSPASSATGDVGSDNAEGRARGSAPEDPAPDFTVTTFEGETFSLSEQRGTPVVLNFWESW